MVEDPPEREVREAHAVGHKRAKEVERLEIAYWEALLSHPACYETVAAVIERRVEDQTLAEVAALRRLCKNAKADKLGKRQETRWNDLCLSLSTKMREPHKQTCPWL